MKKKLLILVVVVISVFNLGVLIENNAGINIGLDYLKIAIAQIEGGEAYFGPACVDPGTNWGNKYDDYKDRECKNEFNQVCGIQYECTYTGFEWSYCTQICCKIQ